MYTLKLKNWRTMHRAIDLNREREEWRQRERKKE